ncbi:MAG: chalcone isomerase family protein [Burkholderiaceae bacterium]|jgi:hypothetical protein
MRHNARLVFLSAWFFCMPGAVAAEAIFAAVPGAMVVGRGVLTYAFLDIYEVTLYAPKGKWDITAPSGLSIKYYRTLKGKDIADRSVQEMRDQGFDDERRLAVWNKQMKAIFPDVKDGMVLSAVYLPGKQTAFYNGTQLLGVIKDDDFGRWFFGIWLSEKTSEPKLRSALLGL